MLVMHLIYLCTISQSVRSSGGEVGLHPVEQDPRSGLLVYGQLPG